jgi:hypothetical protein
MRLTRRGRFVVWLLALTALFLTVNYLNHHWRVTTCHNTADGYTCGTTWKD